jgi:hypothetical protein
MPDVIFPHEFEDNVDQVASGQQVMDNLNAIAAVVNGDLDATNIPDLAILGAYRTILSFPLVSQGAMATGGAAPFLPSGSAMTHGTGTAGTPPMIYLAAADYAVTGKTTKLRVRGQMFTDNGGAHTGVTYTFGLYALAAASGSTPGVVTSGAVIAGSTVAIANPGASAAFQGSSGDFNLPADGYYALGVATSATPVHEGRWAAQLQLRHV